MMESTPNQVLNLLFVSEIMKTSKNLEERGAEAGRRTLILRFLAHLNTEEDQRRYLIIAVDRLLDGERG